MIKDDEDEDDPLYDDNVDHADGNGSYGAQNNDDDSEVEIVEDESADDTTHLVVEGGGVVQNKLSRTIPNELTSVL
jgi:hypothetical protein